MNLYEYQAKEILAQYGVPIPEGGVAGSAEEAEARARGLAAEEYAVKAQIHAGGRGLVGGVRLAATPKNVRTIASELIGSKLVTPQTRKEGEPVNLVYVEGAVDSAQDYFIAVLVDQATSELVVLGSKDGGVDFEERVQKDPGIVSALPIPVDGEPSEAAATAFLQELGVATDLQPRFREILSALARVFVKIDATLVEVNPLTVTPDGAVYAVDAKVSLDNNARYRHPELELLAEETVGDAVELQAQSHEINLVTLDGNIGLVVNGAGLALATQDMVIDAGGKPANFMDIRTTATSLQVARGIGLLLADPKIKVLLVNIHGGGMTTCDTVAEALAFAMVHAKREVPVVFRAAGQNAEYAKTMLNSRRVPHVLADSISEAIERAIAIAA